MFPEILSLLTGKNFQTKDYTLKGFRRIKVFLDGEEQDYPAAVIDKNSQISGKLIMDLDEDSLRIIEAFESQKYFDEEKYKKLTLEGNIIIFIWEAKLNSTSDWTAEEFREKHLEYYLSKKIPKFLEEYNK